MPVGALVEGVRDRGTGQDGSYLAERLLADGVEVHGLVHAATSEDPVAEPPVTEGVVAHEGDLAPDAGYKLAADGLRPRRHRRLMTRPRVAIAHDYLTQRGGAERVVLAMHRAFPEATIHTTLYDAEGTYPAFRNTRIVTSGLNHIGPLRRHHRAALPFLAPASSRLRIDADVVLVSSSGWAHGFDISGRTLVYCHAPARWLYQPATTSAARCTPRGAGSALPRCGRTLSAGTSAQPLEPTATSATRGVVRERIEAAYGIDAEVLHAPIGIDTEASSRPCARSRLGRPGFLLVVSRLMPYKNVAAVIEAVRGTRRAAASSSDAARSGTRWSVTCRANVRILSATSPTRSCAGPTRRPGRSSRPATRTTV